MTARQPPGCSDLIERIAVAARFITGSPPRHQILQRIIWRKRLGLDGDCAQRRLLVETMVKVERVDRMSGKRVPCLVCLLADHSVLLGRCFERNRIGGDLI